MNMVGVHSKGENMSIKEEINAVQTAKNTLAPNFASGDENLGGGTGTDDLPYIKPIKPPLKIRGSGGNDNIKGGDGNDQLEGGAGHDALSGGAGDDYLDGGEGNDLLDGGTGNDTLIGGKGNNVYLFGKGDGQDVINGTTLDTTAGKLNTLQFKAGVAPSDIVLKMVADSDNWGSFALEVSILGTNDKVTINGFFFGDDMANGYNGVQQFKFSDGTVWDLSTIQKKIHAGTADNDTIRGSLAADTINGGAGDDYLNGAGGNDTLNGGEGNDQLYGDLGNDKLSGGNGIDSLDGGEGDDTLEGGAGNDYLSGGTGNNTYLFGKGDGQDIIGGGTFDKNVGKFNTLQFKEGVVTTEVVFKQVQDSEFGGKSALEVSIAGTTNKVTINGFFYGDDTANGNNGVQQIKFADGTVWSAVTIQRKAMVGTKGNDWIRGTVGADVIGGSAGDDYLNGAGGNDTLSGGDGADTLIGEGDNDTLSGGSGNDSLDGGDGDDRLLGGTGDDYLKAGTGNDTLEGGAGNDGLYGEGGDNVYLFGKGDGQDLIDAWDDRGNKLNTLQFKTGVSTSDVLFKLVNDNHYGGYKALEISIAGTTDKVTINGFFNQWESMPVQQIKFADGTIWDITYLSDAQTGTAGSDSLIGGGVMFGGPGDDSLVGDKGSNILDGGEGNDHYMCSKGNDVYMFGKGDGEDVINYIWLGNSLTLQFKAGVATTDVVLKAVRSPIYFGLTTLEVSLSGSTDKVLIPEFFFTCINPNSYLHCVPQIRFADGTVWDLATIQSKLMVTTAGNDHVHGTIGNDVINGGKGDDHIDGYEGDDILDGGEGNDTLFGGGGNDVFFFGKGDGQDLICYGERTIQSTTLIFKALVLPSDIVLKRTYESRWGFVISDLEVSITGTTDKVCFKEFICADDPMRYGVTMFKFADGTTWDLNAILSKLYTSTNANDTIRGTVLADVISGGAGNDYLIGLEGNDALHGDDGADSLIGGGGDDTLSGGDGADALTGDGGNDKLDGGVGDDSLDAGEGNDTLIGGAGNDGLNGGGGDDTLDGGAGNDALVGGDGNDTLDGGAGNDVLNGKAGNNIFLFGKGDGQDVIGSVANFWENYPDKLYASTLQLKDGVRTSELAFKQVYDSSGNGVSSINIALEVSILGTTDKVTINEFFLYDDPANPYNGVQQIKFADGTVWNTETILNKLFAGTGGNDTIRGTVKADVINGGAGNDNLLGMGGNDTLNGGSGNDTLSGGAGDDTYLFGRGFGADLISEYDSTKGNTDVLSVGAGVSAQQIWFRRINTDLEVSIIGGTDKVTIGNWYSDSAYHVEKFKTSDGKTLQSGQVDSLVAAMAVFTPPTAGQTTLPPSYLQALTPVIAANWK
jgi:trimeric autotransporter adhesin